MNPIVEEIIIDGKTYIRETYENGTINEYLKPTPIEPIDPSLIPIDSRTLQESMALNLEYLVAISELGGNA